MSFTGAAANPRQSEAGFTLFEALVAVALMGLILSILGVITGQWLPRWRAGFHRIERTELVSLALDRITSDLAAAEYMTPIGDPNILFYGSADSVTFVRAPIGPKPSTGPAPTGLEIIKIAGGDDGGLSRSRAVFTPQSSVAAKSEDFEFSDKSLLLRPPLKISFGFAGADRVWSEAWTDSNRLPAAVRITVRDGPSDEILAASTAALIHVNAPASCAATGGGSQCLSEPGKAREPAAPNASPPAGSAPPHGAVL
ncbi:putative general secretion pathway protein J [Methylocella silvestris BL2]|uniref:Putative general secretion pathway protein J n=1 Tax=Methylocella silvestris (strain DSM 15510 / CIP 108128 / LMG 27833 / NCIMB 13906 / BL2) TaxID=395965 RepID=B8ESJ5_METSB|nr:type II secretion system protein [Methylocella silvestris]ACK49885.1 putative general secretion pathway protein J [Methylocella silvestris BL2]